MPYITQERRDALVTTPPECAGELNYCITRLIVDYVRARGESYHVFNDVLGALSGAQAEFYRRVAAPYEDEKCKLNGDVYQ